uniref:HMG box domain-containing protein n=1 Tax=Clastoptera arizonana TaxID=38151 RepID=A0A1B6DPS8_9HEMI
MFASHIPITWLLWSAFFYFTLDERPKIMKAKPNFNIRDVSRELGKRWVEIDKAKKAKYTNMSKSDQVRFLKELKAYERKTRLSASSENYDTPGEASTSEQKKEEN